jgi:hypothetical protein
MTVMFHLQCESKEYDEKSLELAAVQYQENKSVESTQLTDPLGRACGPSGVWGPPTEKLIIYIHVLMIIYWDGSLHIERKMSLFWLVLHREFCYWFHTPSKFETEHFN